MSSSTDSDGLGAGLYTELSLGGAGGFSWFQYTGIEARYNFTDLATMRTSMAAEFDGTNWLEIDTAAATAYPITMLCWFKTSTDATQALMWIGDKDVTNRYQAMRVTGTTLFVDSRDSAGQVSAEESTYDPDDGNWHFACGVYGESSRVAYFDDAVGTPETTNIPITAVYDRTTIGHLGDSSPPFAEFTGTIDNAYIFSPALKAAEIAYMRANKPPYDQLVAQYAAGATNCPNPSNVQGHWPLGEHTLGRTDGSGNGLILAEGGTNPVVGVAGIIDRIPQVEDRALAFDGVDQYAHNANTVGDYGTSWSVWVRSAEKSAYKYAMWCGDTGSTDDWFGVAMSTNGYLQIVEVHSTGANVIAGDLVDHSDGLWHHVVAVWTSVSSRTMYVDGVKTSDSLTAGTLATLNGFAIGRANGGPTPGFEWNGDIDEPMVFSGALSDADVAALYNSGAGILNGDSAMPTGRTHHWSLSKNNIDGPGEDLVGEFDLTLAGTPDPTDTPGIPAGQRNGQVSLVSDLSGNGNDLAQATLSLRPEVVHVADGSGYGLRFDGVDDYLVSAAFSGALTQPNTIIATSQPTTTAGTFCDGIVGTSEQRLGRGGASLLRMDSGTQTDTSLTMAAGTLSTAVGIFNGASGKAYVDGGAGDTSVSSGAETMTGVTVGMLLDLTTAPFTGTMRQLLVNDSELSTAELNAIGGKLASDQGLTWTDIA